MAAVLRTSAPAQPGARSSVPGRADGATHGARIGPNAVIQMGEALRANAGREFERNVFMLAGLQCYLVAPPGAMIPEGEAIAIFQTLFRDAGVSSDDANAIARDAGLRTGDYILANRIPKAAQSVLKVLPRPLAARALLGAIGKHSWTFAGSGRVTCRYGRLLSIEIANNPLAFDGCAWHCAVFERLFGAIVYPQVHVKHTGCCAAGNEACRFEIRPSGLRG